MRDQDQSDDYVVMGRVPQSIVQSMRQCSRCFMIFVNKRAQVMHLENFKCFPPWEGVCLDHPRVPRIPHQACICGMYLKTSQMSHHRQSEQHYLGLRSTYDKFRPSAIICVCGTISTIASIDEHLYSNLHVGNMTRMFESGNFPSHTYLYRTIPWQEVCEKFHHQQEYLNRNFDFMRENMIYLMDHRNMALGPERLSIENINKQVLSHYYHNVFRYNGPEPLEKWLNHQKIKGIDRNVFEWKASDQIKLDADTYVRKLKARFARRAGLYAYESKSKSDLEGQLYCRNTKPNTQHLQPRLHRQRQERELDLYLEKYDKECFQKESIQGKVSQMFSELFAFCHRLVDYADEASNLIAQNRLRQNQPFASFFQENMMKNVNHAIFFQVTKMSIEFVLKHWKQMDYGMLVYELQTSLMEIQTAVSYKRQIRKLQAANRQLHIQVNRLKNETDPELSSDFAAVEIRQLKNELDIQRQLVFNTQDDLNKAKEQLASYLKKIKMLQDMLDATSKERDLCLDQKDGLHMQIGELQDKISRLQYDHNSKNLPASDGSIDFVKEQGSSERQNYDRYATQALNALDRETIEPQQLRRINNLVTAASQSIGLLQESNAQILSQYRELSLQLQQLKDDQALSERARIQAAEKQEKQYLIKCRGLEWQNDGQRVYIEKLRTELTQTHINSKQLEEKNKTITKLKQKISYLEKRCKSSSVSEADSQFNQQMRDMKEKLDKQTIRYRTDIAKLLDSKNQQELRYEETIKRLNQQMEGLRKIALQFENQAKQYQRELQDLKNAEIKQLEDAYANQYHDSLDKSLPIILQDINEDDIAPVTHNPNPRHQKQEVDPDPNHNDDPNPNVNPSTTPISNTNFNTIPVADVNPSTYPSISANPFIKAVPIPNTRIQPKFEQNDPYLVQMISKDISQGEQVLIQPKNTKTKYKTTKLPQNYICVDSAGTDSQIQQHSEQTPVRKSNSRKVFLDDEQSFYSVQSNRNRSDPPPQKSKMTPPRGLYDSQNNDSIDGKRIGVVLQTPAPNKKVKTEEGNLSVSAKKDIQQFNQMSPEQQSSVLRMTSMYYPHLTNSQGSKVSMEEIARRHVEQQGRNNSLSSRNSGSKQKKQSSAKNTSKNPFKNSPK